MVWCGVVRFPFGLMYGRYPACNKAGFAVALFIRFEGPVFCNGLKLSGVRVSIGTYPQVSTSTGKSLGAGEHAEK